MDNQFSKFEEQVFLNTVLIKNTTKGEFGTGFLIIKKVDEKLSKYLLFSNKHVFFGKNYKSEEKTVQKIEITLHKKGEKNSLEETHTFSFNIGGSVSDFEYKEHENDSIDVACVNISQAFNVGVSPNVIPLDLDDFADFNPNELFCGQTVVFVGYPVGFFDKKFFLPVLRTGVISSIPHIDFEGIPQLLIDAQVFPGSSGSPVFVKHNNQYKLLGIISSSVFHGLEHLVKNASGSEKKIELPVEYIGLGVVFKHTTIKDVYNKM